MHKQTTSAVELSGQTAHPYPLVKAPRLCQALKNQSEISVTSCAPTPSDTRYGHTLCPPSLILPATPSPLSARREERTFVAKAIYIRLGIPHARGRRGRRSCWSRPISVLPCAFVWISLVPPRSAHNIKRNCNGNFASLASEVTDRSAIGNFSWDKYLKIFQGNVRIYRSLRKRSDR